MRRTVFCLCLSVFLFQLLAAGLIHQAAAQASIPATPAGRWRTTDDRTGKVKSLVVLSVADGKLYGRIDKIVNPDADNPNHRCIHCDGALKDKELIGMQIVWDLKRDGDTWSGGYVFDPDNGKTYKCTMTLEDGGKRLKVRGFIGISLLGRTQYWDRDE